MTITKTTQIDATRWLAVGSLTALIILGLAWEMWLLLFTACALHVRIRLKNGAKTIQPAA
jgi:uncharacterized membrane protein